jgi:mono/diheme cytochrome c family protein|tara:strand:- start:505 stop:831 length:327 start_codon:yes stop_codon:yes gene_type:complete
MKILKFLLIVFFISLSGNFKSFSDEAMMKKGLEIFNETAACAACHVLKAAGSEGNIGPNLDTVTMTVESVKEMVTYGLGVMPAFGEGEILTKEEIEIVSQYVVNVANK